MPNHLIEPTVGAALGESLNDAGANHKVARKTIEGVAGVLSKVDPEFSFESFVIYATEAYYKCSTDE